MLLASSADGMQRILDRQRYVGAIDLPSNVMAFNAMIVLAAFTALVEPSCSSTAAAQSNRRWWRSALARARSSALSGTETGKPRLSPMMRLPLQTLTTLTALTALQAAPGISCAVVG